MARTMKAIEEAPAQRDIAPLEATAYSVAGPWKIEAQRRTIASIPKGFVLLRMLTAGICAADLRYIAGRRPPEVLERKLPLVPCHEGVAEVLEVGPGVEEVSPGDVVAVVPNIPCYIHDPQAYPSRDEACPACRPGGAGENYCMDVAFLASTVDGLAQTHLLHPAWGVIKLGKSIPPDVASLAEPISVAVRAMKQIDVPHEGRIFVLGAGVVGFLVVLTLGKLHNVARERIVATDVREPRLEAIEPYATTFLPDNITATMRESGLLVFECAGGQAAHRTVPQAIDLLLPGGVCMLLGVTEGPLPISTRPILDKGLCIRGTTRSDKSDMVEAVKMLADKKFREAAGRILCPETFEVDSAESLLSAARAADSPSSYGRVILRFQQGGSLEGRSSLRTS